MRARRPGHALAVACGAFVALAWLWQVTFHTEAGRWLDDAVLLGFVGLRWEPLSGWAEGFARLADPGSFLVLLAALIAIAWIRGRRRMALLVAITLPLANLTAQMLKPLLAAPRATDFLGHGQIAEAAWPSGHATASMSLALGLVLVSAPRWRPLAASVGGLFATIVPFSILLLGWHYPSDVLAGYAVAVAFVCGALAIAWSMEPERERPPIERLSLGELSPPLLTALLCCGLALAVALARFDAVSAYAQAHTAFFVGAAALGALALTIASALALLMRSPRH